MNATTTLEHLGYSSTAYFPTEKTPHRIFAIWSTFTSSGAISEQQSSTNYGTSPADPTPALAYVEAFLHLHAQFEKIIHEAKGHAFFDGMNSKLAEKTGHIIAMNGTIAVDALQLILNKHHNEIETVEEILRQVGLVQDKPTHQHRLNLLNAMLVCQQERIRDAASLGLSFMEDPAALDALYATLQAEKVPWVRTNLSLVIEQLEQMQCPNT